MTFNSINPATEEKISSTDVLKRDALQHCINTAGAAQKEWGSLPLERRVDVLVNLRHVLERNVVDSAELITREMGKPIVQARAEVRKCMTVCDFMADAAPRLLAPQDVPSGYSSSMVHREPLGVVLAIMPWNFPYWQFLRFAIPALIAGNGVLLKHAPSTLGCAAELKRLCEEAGLPEGLLANVPVDTPMVKEIIAHPSVRAVTLTGSTRAGAAVASEAGRHVKKTVLELGGSDAYVVLADADLEHAARVCTESRMLNSGQSCIAAKRFVVVESVAEAFTEALVAEMKKKIVGDPLDPATDVGPLARRDLRDGLADQVRRSLAGGARIAWQYAKVPDIGWYMPPMVLTHVGPGNTAFDEELFGPIAPVAVAADNAEALAMANNSRYGLGAAVFTRDADTAAWFAARLEAGTVAVNDYTRSDAHLPFGGVKDSGYGRELGDQGLLEFTSTKTIVM